MYGYIYKTTNLINNKIYIGQHKKNIFDPSYKGSGKIFTKVLRKYGKENFETVLLEAFETKEALNEAEIYYIKLYDARNPSVGYNLAEGGNLFSNDFHQGMLGKHQSEFQKQQVTKALKGKPKSEQARANMRESAKKRILNRITNNGKRWINNGTINIMILSSEPLPEGYQEGMIPSAAKSESQRKIHSRSIYMHNNVGDEKLVDINLVSEYKERGYIEGRRPYSAERIAKLKARKGKILIHNPITYKMLYISPNELLEYESLGYIKGKLKKQ